MKTVLLIEDDLAMRENTAEILELANYKVISASNGLSGIAKAEKHLPDIILCDILMPKTNGYKVLKILSENQKTNCIPFVFISVNLSIVDLFSNHERENVSGNFFCILDHFLLGYF